MDPAESRSLHDFAAVLFRHKRRAGLFFIGVMIGVTAYTLFCPRVYRSQAKLFVRLGRENATLDPTATIGQAPVVAGLQSRENEINTAVEVLNSRLLLEKVVDSVGSSAILGGTEPRPPDPSDTLSSEATQERYRAIAKLTKRLNVEPVKKSNVVAISYDGPSPEIAQTVVSKLVAYYLDRHIELNRTPRAHQFLAEQTARQRAQLTRAEEQLRDLKNETGLIVPEGQRQILVNRMGRLEDELLQTMGALAAAEAEVGLLRDKLTSLSPTHVTARTKGVRNEAADNMRGQLYALQLRELESTLKYPEGHPDLKRVRQQAAAAKNILVREEQDREQLTEGPDRVYEETQLALLKEEPVLSSLRAKVEILRSQLEQQRLGFKALNENSLRIARLEREFGLQESHYRRYADNLEQAQIDCALEAERMSNISVVQPATYDIEPVQPRPLLYLGLGTFLAVLGSLGLALQAEHTLRAQKTREDAEKQRRIPVLESMPVLSTSALTAKAGARHP
jgi:uncharacterized protein involved in exopolysaccharide biosynthesis